MKSRNFVNFLRLGSVSLLLFAVLLTVLQLIRYSRIRSVFPIGTKIAGVLVGGLNQKEAADRLTQIYGIPIELYYGSAVIQMKPAAAGFQLDLETMLVAADIQRVNQPFWSAFWNYLWNQMPTPTEIPLRANISEDRLRTFLENEIAIRYDSPPISAVSLTGSPEFSPGQPGTILDVEGTIALVVDALRSPSARRVNLSLNKVSPLRPSMQNLQVLLQRITEISQYDGLIEIYLLDLQTRQEIHFAYQGGATVNPDIAFTAASTMKIPIMISAFIKENEPLPPIVAEQIRLMIDRSDNDSTDKVMEHLEANRGPLIVTEKMQALGFVNTFIAGFFYPGAPLLQRYLTPANQRTDINLSPDIYNQTTPAEIGMLLDDIYQCAQNGGGSLFAVFPDQITQNECKLMINYLALNRIGVLIQAGVPEGTQVAHKHGWILESDGLIHTISDVGIIYTPGGNYVFTIYLYNPSQLSFEPANKFVAQLSKAIYNYFNLPTQ